MKSIAVTLLLVVFVAYAGSFLTVWTLPHQSDPYTIHDLQPVVEKAFDTACGLEERDETLFAGQEWDFEPED